MWKLGLVLTAALFIAGCDKAQQPASSSNVANKVVARSALPAAGRKSPEKTVAGSGLRKTYTMNESFDTVKEAVKDALTDRGLVVNNIAHISNMLQRTGKDLGKTKKIYQKAENIEFCSAVVSRKTMEADPHNIIYCPYIISVYVLAKEPKKVYVSYRKLPRVKDKKSDQALQEVEKLLDNIAKEATE